MRAPAATPDSSPNQSAAYALLMAMTDASRVHWHSDWAPHLQDLLWSDVERVLNQKKPKTLSMPEAAALAWLFTEADGWWSWAGKENSGPSFIDREEWEQ